MTYLLDVSTLLSLIWASSSHHETAKRWRVGKKIALCPITELGFLRVSTSPAFNATMEQSRKALADFIADEGAVFIPADIRALDGKKAITSKTTTDWYLANLAEKWGMKWATLDSRANHSAAEVI